MRFSGGASASVSAPVLLGRFAPATAGFNMANGAIEADLEVGGAEVGMTKGGNSVAVSGGGLPKAENVKERLSTGGLGIA
jgi:hypothetical protein